MKKILRTIILITVCCLAIIISGCDSGNGYDYAPISEIRENFSQTADELRTREFDNIVFKNTEFSFPEIDSISELSLDEFSGKNAQEIYDFFCESLESLVPGKYSDELKMNKIIFTDGERDAQGNFPTIKEYKLTANPFPMFLVDDCFMDMHSGVLRWFDNADLMKWCGEEGDPAMQTMPSKTRPVKKFITDMDSTEKYELINGEISIKDAAEFVNNYLETMNFSPYEISARSKTVAVSVVDIGGGKYGYNFIITPIYKNVLFDYAEIKGGTAIRFVNNDYDNRDYDNFPGQIGMIETDKVYNFAFPVYNRTIAETEAYTSIITLENAAEIINEFFSQSMRFGVQRVQVVYLPYLNKAEPCWKFLMTCNGETYNAFVNMITGEVHVYIQG